MEFQKKNILLIGSGITLAINPKAYTANFSFDDVAPENYVPKDGEFIEIDARALSNVIVAPNTYRATEFPAEVLKAAMGFLVNKNFFSDHLDYTENSKGVVISSTWQDSYIQDGEIVPGGINVVLRIDTVSEPKLARKILSGELAAVSVGVEFTWTASHPFDNIWDFYDKIGTYDENGVMIRRIAKEITQFRELSIVPIGADPFACVIKEDKLTRIDKARASKAMLSMFSDKESFEPKKAGDSNNTETIGALQVETLNFALHEKNKQINNDMNKELLKLLGLSETATFDEAKNAIIKAVESVNLTQEKYNALVTEKEALQTQLNDTIEREKDAITAKQSAEALLAEAKESVAKYETFAVKYNEQIAQRKERIKATYQATNNASAAFLALIDKAEDTQLSELEKEFGVGLVQNLGVCCESCGGEKFTTKKPQVNEEEYEQQDVDVVAVSFNNELGF